MESTFERTPRGKIITEGKTKIIREHPNNHGLVDVESKDDITAGDGKKHDLMKGKAVLSTETTCNVFNLLHRSGIPVAFKERAGDTVFTAERCTMLPYEVVVRREAHGSFLKRHPQLPKGYEFQQPLVEFFLKTKDRLWKDLPLLADDPLLLFVPPQRLELYEPGRAMPQQPFLTLDARDVFSTPQEAERFTPMMFFASQTFLILERAWAQLGKKLVDFKVEFGINRDGELLLADVIDNDSWRLLDTDGTYLDKQVYRDNGSLDATARKYARVAELSKRLRR
jgi:phosphoribosylaminoimidazole-succinocarboxamide synthase